MDWLEDTVDRLIRGVSGTNAEEIRTSRGSKGRAREVTVWGPNGYGVFLIHPQGDESARASVLRVTARGVLGAYGIPGAPGLDGTVLKRDEIKALAFRLSLMQNNFADSVTMDHRA